MNPVLVVLVALAGLGVGPLLAELARAVPLGQPVRPGWPPTRRTVVVSAATAGLAGLVAAHVGPSWWLPAQLWLAGLAVVLTVTDLQHRRLPNALLLPGGAVLAGLLVLAALVDREPGRLLGGLVAGGALLALFLVAAVVSPTGMGMGDVKLAGVLGLALGVAGTPVVVLAVLVALALHAVVSVLLLAVRRAGRRTALPFGPPLLIGSALSLGWFTPLL